MRVPERLCPTDYVAQSRKGMLMPTVIQALDDHSQSLHDLGLHTQTHRAFIAQGGVRLWTDRAIGKRSSPCVSTSGKLLCVQNNFLQI